MKNNVHKILLHTPIQGSCGKQCRESHVNSKSKVVKHEHNVIFLTDPIAANCCEPKTNVLYDFPVHETKTRSLEERVEERRCPYRHENSIVVSCSLTSSD